MKSILMIEDEKDIVDLVEYHLKQSLMISKGSFQIFFTRPIAIGLLLASALLLTDVFFPKRYWEYVFHFHLAWVVLLRNLVLVGLLVALTLPVRARAHSS